MQRNIIVGITGASGAAYATRLIELLVEAEVHVHVVISALGRRLLFDELNMRRVDAGSLAPARPDLITMYSDGDVGARIASGSFLNDGMVVVPCSANTLGGIASGLGDNLVKRAAAVALKERRKLILAYRESPMSHIDILNMQRLSEAGAVIAPLAPGFYLLPKSIDELVDFMVARLLDLLSVEHTLNMRWKQEDESVERAME